MKSYFLDNTASSLEAIFEIVIDIRRLKWDFNKNN